MRHLYRFSFILIFFTAFSGDSFDRGRWTRLFPGNEFPDISCVGGAGNHIWFSKGRHLLSAIVAIPQTVTILKVQTPDGSHPEKSFLLSRRERFRQVMETGCRCMIFPENLSKSCMPERTVPSGIAAVVHIAYTRFDGRQREDRAAVGYFCCDRPSVTDCNLNWRWI